jgi:acyl-CoA thioester hydrolase
VSASTGLPGVVQGALHTLQGAGAADFSHLLRVYWEDTDAGGVVFYANYLKFFERARTEWLRSLGVAQQALREATGAIFIVADTALHYRAPARLDDLLRITVRPLDTGRASMTLAQQAWRMPADPADTAAPLLLCEGNIRIGCVDAGSFRPRRFPSPITEALCP